MPTDFPPLTLGNFYHIYNRGNNRENIFRQERNYDYFLNLWWKHTSPVAETWAYCLLKNHFHAVVYIKDREEHKNRTADLTGLKADLSGLKDPSKYFSNFFNAYARGFNIAAQWTGALFERPFKRIPVDRTDYLMQLIVYLHQNPQKHKFTTDFRTWKHSSYPVLISDTPTVLQREKTMELFGSREDFVRIHQEIRPVPGMEDVE